MEERPPFFVDEGIEGAGGGRSRHGKGLWWWCVVRDGDLMAVVLIVVIETRPGLVAITAVVSITIILELQRTGYPEELGCLARNCWIAWIT